ncbi:hypothetical protein PAHAL_4G260500 [Panicum hallii]|uniref:Uncharacterized protein n=1 Tax=Panicum hallii TaxID=206008 RepID=A0A2T8JDZ3_9POAL|nr:hypothetical protein PAHAL_4G260500 [Panicum hallii]
MIADRSEPQLAFGSDGFGVFLARSRACDGPSSSYDCLAVSCSSGSALVWWMLQAAESVPGCFKMKPC